jgi:hypothetical protein
MKVWSLKQSPLSGLYGFEIIFRNRSLIARNPLV